MLSAISLIPSKTLALAGPRSAVYLLVATAVRTWRSLITRNLDLKIGQPGRHSFVPIGNINVWRRRLGVNPVEPKPMLANGIRTQLDLLDHPTSTKTPGAALCRSSRRRAYLSLFHRLAAGCIELELRTRSKLRRRCSWSNTAVLGLSFNNSPCAKLTW